jgi:mono/diheme cytochrome c family protein
MSTADTIAAVAFVLLGFGCETNMYDQPRYEPLEASSFFEDGLSARPRMAHTVARGELQEDEALYRGTENGRVVEQFPIQVTATTLARGEQRYEIYCSPCHGLLGDGTGMIVRRGFKPPPSYHIDRLRNAPVGYLYNVISTGFGAMFSYAEDIAPADRWAIIAYVRALQLSQHAELADLPADVRHGLIGAAP